MKKALAIVLILALCATTVIAYGDYFKKDELSESGLLAQADDFEDIRLALKESGMFDRDNYRTGLDSLKLYGVIEDASSAADMGGMPESAFDTFVDAEESTGTAGAGFSQTNVQIQGIDEADVIKTDGEDLYIAAGESIYIVRLISPEVDEENPEMELVTVLNLDEFSHADNIMRSKSIT